MDNMRGFTLIEVVVVIGIFVGIISLGLFLSMETFRGTLYRSEVSTIVSVLERARDRAMNNVNQTTWGVCYLGSSYVIIKGAACVQSSVQDTIIANPGVAQASGFPSSFPVVQFSQLAGTTTGATIAVRQNDRTQTITINNEGTILW